MPETPIEHEIFEKEDDVYTEPNRVQVSALNNLFSQPFANSYRVGLNEETIFAIATVVDELSATRFGAFPLYVFTDRGVWSLESGHRRGALFEHSAGESRSDRKPEYLCGP